MHYTITFFNFSAMEKKFNFRKPLTQAELEKLADHFLESDDDLQDSDEENESENVDSCMELAAGKISW